MKQAKAMSEPLQSRYIAAEEIRPTVEYAGRGEFDTDRWWQGKLIQPCLMLIESGKLDGRTSAGNFLAPARSLACFRPAAKRAWGIIAPAMVWEIGVRFALPPQQHLVPWLPDVGPTPLFVTLGDLFERTRRLFESIYAELPRALMADQLRVRSAVFELLAIMREASRTKRNAERAGAPPGKCGLLQLDAWQRARLRLESDLMRPLTIETVAHDLGVTPDYFTRRFRRRFGISPHVCRTHAKLREGLRMLRHGAESGGEPVKTVAYRLGFSDPKAFARVFKRHLGVNPSQVTAGGGATANTSLADAGSPGELFPGNTHVLPADRESIGPFNDLTDLIATAPPPFPASSIVYRRSR